MPRQPHQLAAQTLGLALLCVLALLSGCTQGDDSAFLVKGEPTILHAAFWNTPTDHATRTIFDEAVDQFNLQEEHVQVKISYIPDEEHKTKLAVDMAANTPPDIFMTWSAGFLEPFVNAGKVYDLTNTLAQDPKWHGNFHPHSMTHLTFDNRLHAVPLSRSAVGIYYNYSLFAKHGLAPPKTLADLENVIATFRTANITPFAFGNAFPWVGGMLGGMLIQRVGGHVPYDAVAKGYGTWLDPSFLRAGKILQRLVRLGAFPKNCNSVTYEEAINMFKNGQAAMLLMGFWTIPPPPG